MMRKSKSGLVPALVISVLLHFGVIAGYRSMPGDFGRVTSASARLSVALARLNPTETEVSPVVDSVAIEEVALNPMLAPVMPQETARDSEKQGSSGGGVLSSDGRQDNSYLPSHLLDRRPEVIKDISRNPSALSVFTEGGTIVLVLGVSEQGRVEKVVEESSSLPAAMTEEVKKEMETLRFRPGTVNGAATRFSMRVEVSVKPEQNVFETSATPSLTP